jgi:NAD(P)-dependent dehydrogenase (short-subunit alcohol dehydrogenase family)
MQDKRVALVTGANQGIGAQIAKDLVAHGFTVLVGSRNLERGEAAAKEIGPNAIALQLDVTDQASITAAVQRIRRETGRLDVLINNAAISNTRKTPGMSIQEYTRTPGQATYPLTRCVRCGRPTCSVCSPSPRRCCRSSERRRQGASSTFRAALAH